MGNIDQEALARIAALERELASLKASMAQGTPRSEAGADAFGSAESSGAQPRDVPVRAEQLLDRLLESRRLVSYTRAYELLFGEAPNPFRNAVHVRPVIEVAMRTAPRQFGGLEVRLDSLIVSLRGRQPGPGHFRTAPYTLNEWIAVFGAWPFSD